MQRAKILKTLGVAIIGSALVGFLGCGDDKEEGTSITPEGSSGQTPTAGVPSDMFVHQNLGEMVHLADVDQDGLFIDFGTPSRFKYTVGNWNTVGGTNTTGTQSGGWGSDGTDGPVTYTNASKRGRVFFHLDAQASLTIRLRLKAVGTRRLSPYFNGDALDAVSFQDGGFKDYSFEVPSDKTKAGENQLLLTFGGTSTVNGEDVSVSMESIRVVQGDVPPGEYKAPTLASLRGEVDGRPAILLNRPSTLSYHVEIPPDGKLAFGVRMNEGAQGAGNVSVKVTTDGSETADFSGSAGDDWDDQLMDLSSMAGKVARIQFIAGGSGAGQLAISSPTLVVPKRAVEPRPAKNVVVLLIDTLRASKLKAYNPSSRVRTPVIDRLAGEGTVFERAHSPENWTKPSCASILTGLYPMTHGAKRSESRLPDEALLLSEHLKANGFKTGSFIANGYVSDRFGFDQGWDSYTNYIRESKSTEAENVFGEAAAFIEANKSSRFFTYIQTIDPHVPYDPPEEFVQMYDRQAYDGQVSPRATHDLLEKAKRNPPQVTFNAADKRRLAALHDGEISYHDRELGRFIDKLRELGVWNNTLLVIVSDHGEEFNDHDSWGHGHSLYQELLHVPLIFRLPGTVPSGRRSETVTTLDIPATVLQALGAPPLPAQEGRSLLGLMHGQTPSGPLFAFSDHMFDRRAASSAGYKIVVRGNNRVSFFDLNNDYAEQNNLKSHRAPRAYRYLRVHHGQFLAATNRGRWTMIDQSGGGSLQAEEAEMDDQIRNQLRALGYAE